MKTGQRATELMPASRAGSLDRAVWLLRRGGLVAFPTDTVYGVGALAWDEDAVASIYVAKQRPPDKAIPLLISSRHDLLMGHDLIEGPLAATAQRLAARFWPGPVTLVVPCSPRVPAIVTGGGRTVAVRVPDHPVAAQLLAALGAPLAATSANLSGQPSTLTAHEVMAQLGGRIDLVLDGGPCPGGLASTVVDTTCAPPALLRAGPVALSEILAALADG